jgi:hypothetical protein
MTLFFNILVLEEETRGDPNYMIEALGQFYNNRSLPKDSRQKYKPIRKSLAGTSFLLNPQDFFNDKTTDIIYKAQYLRLAGRRDYIAYKFYRIKYLDLSYYNDIILSQIAGNPLLEINSTQIKFKYEEK